MTDRSDMIEQINVHPNVIEPTLNLPLAMAIPSGFNAAINTTGSTERADVGRITTPRGALAALLRTTEP
jgi:hypothetical protein